MKTSSINIHVSVDENNIPEKIDWAAEAGNEGGEAKAMLLSFWDGAEKNTLRIDLWTREMTIDEMKQFFHQSLLTMTDSFERATNEKELVQDMRDFCNYFAIQTGLVQE